MRKWLIVLMTAVAIGSTAILGWLYVGQDRKGPEITIAEYNPPNNKPANIPKLFKAYCKNTLIPSPIKLANGPTTTKAKNPVKITVINGVNNISNMLGTIFLTFFSIIDIKNITNNIGNTVP